MGIYIISGWKSFFKYDVKSREFMGYLKFCGGGGWIGYKSDMRMEKIFMVCK